jgi:hypothetical protein
VAHDSEEEEESEKSAFSLKESYDCIDERIFYSNVSDLDNVIVM